MCAWATAFVLAVAVQGTVTLQQKPVAGARVQASRDRFFHPAAKRAEAVSGARGVFRIELPAGAWWLRASYEAASEDGAFAAVESAAAPVSVGGGAAAKIELVLDRAERRDASFHELEVAGAGKPIAAPWREALARARKERSAEAAQQAVDAFTEAVRSGAAAGATVAAREAAEAAEPLCALAEDATSCLVGIATLADLGGPGAVGRAKEARAALTADPREAARIYGEAAELHRRAGDAYRQAEALGGRARALLRAGAGEPAAAEARREALFRQEVEDACGEGAALALAGRALQGGNREPLLREGLKRLKPCAVPDDALGIAHTEDLLLAALALGDRAEMEAAAGVAAKTPGAHLAAARLFEALERWGEAAERYRLLGEPSRRDLLRALTRVGSEEAVALSRALRDPVAEGEALVAWSRTLLDAGNPDDARKALLDAGLAFDAAERPRDADAVRRLYPQLEAKRADRLCAEGLHADEALARAAAAFHYRKVGEFSLQGEQLLLRLIALSDAGDALAAEPAAKELEDVYGAPGVRAGWEERLLRARQDPGPDGREREKAIQLDEPRRRLAQTLFWRAAARESLGRTTAAQDLEDAARRLEAAGEAEGSKRAWHRAAAAYERPRAAEGAPDSVRAKSCRDRAAEDPAELAAVAEADRALQAGDPGAALTALSRAGAARPAAVAGPADVPPWLEIARKEWPKAARDRRDKRLSEMAAVLEAAGDPAAKDALAALAKLYASSRARDAAAAAQARAAAPSASLHAALLLALAARRPVAFDPPAPAPAERFPPFLYYPPPADVLGPALQALLSSRPALAATGAVP